MKIDTSVDKINELLTRGVDEVIVKDHLKNQLQSGKKLRVKLGIDPTSPHLHIGRSIPLLKMRDFQELGHQLVFIVGDSTGVIGDTSDKDSERPMLAQKQVEENMKNYVAQAGKIIDIKKCEVRYNSEWLNKLGHKEIGAQAEQFSLHEFNARENIKRRLDAGTRVSLREILYPLMQGYDSVAVKADVELGGTDQRFNLLAGRTLQEFYKQPPQDIVMGPLLEGTDGRKMSSSWGNTINLTDEPNEIFGKIMTIPDDLIIKYFTLTTRGSLTTIRAYAQAMQQGANPRDFKMKLGFELVRMYHSEKAAASAENYFVSTFRDKEKPTDIPTFKLTKNDDIISVLLESKLCLSRTEARRALAQGGVYINDKRVGATDIWAKVRPDDVVQKGKRWFVRIKN